VVGDREARGGAGGMMILPLSWSARADDPVITGWRVAHSGASSSILVFAGCPRAQA